MTCDELETLLYERVKKACLPISGQVYYRGMRPIQNEQDEHKEDCVVSVLTGTGGEVAKGSCLVNVYVPDILVSSGLYLKNRERCSEISEVLDTLPEVLRKECPVYFTRSEMILTESVPDLREHFVSLKMDFKFIQSNY
ncbi:MAG: hypothetical protein ACI30J_08875 [Paludibacteraceae bacterium]